MWNKWRDNRTQGLFLISFFLIAFTQIALCFQGVDLCDEGWCLTFYQNFFSNPSCCEYQYAYYTTGFLGGIFNLLFPDAGILYYRFLNVVFILLSVLIAYKFLSRYFNPGYLLGGFFLILFDFDWGSLVLHHNTVSSFITILVVVTLMLGIEKRSFVMIFISGVMLSIDVFSRIPTVTLLALGVVFITNALMNKIAIHEVTKQVAYWTAGFLLGLLIMIGIMAALGHLQTMVDSLLGIIHKGGSQESNHSFTRLLHVYIRNYIDISKRGLFLIALYLVNWAFFQLFNKSRLRSVWGYGVVVLLTLTSVFLFLHSLFDVYFLYAIALLATLLLLLSTKSSSIQKNIAIAGAIILLLHPLGSDWGVFNFGAYCLWISLPLACSVLLDRFLLSSLDIAKRTYSLSRAVLLIMTIVIGISFIVVKAHLIANYAYFDKGSRFEKTYTINNPRAKGVYTTQRRAAIINSLLPELSQWVKEGDVLFAYDNIPMIHFLTQTRPYLGTSWVWVYDPNSFQRAIERAETAMNECPIVLIQKFVSIGDDFSAPLDPYLDENRPDDYLWNSHRTRIMNQFLNRHVYEPIWSNEYFEILQSKKKNVTYSCF